MYFKIKKSKLISKNQDLILLQKLVLIMKVKLISQKIADEAVKAKVSAVKFQFHVLEDEMLRYTPKSQNFSESLYDTLKEPTLI